MARKTKRQKILARLHRLQTKVEDQSPAAQRNTSEKTEINASTDQKINTSYIEHEPPQRPTNQEISYDYSYVYKDLRKIFILTVLALAAEIFLSLTASSSYAKLVLRALNLD